MALPTLNTFTPNTTIESAKVNENFTNLLTYLDDEIEDYKNIAFRVGLSGNQSVTNATPTTIAFDTEVFDLGSDFNVSTYKFVVPVTGYYMIGAGIRIASLADGKYVQLAIKNGSTEIDTRAHWGGAANNWSMSASGLHYLTADDELTVVVTHNDTTARDISTGNNWTVFWGYRIKI